MKKLVSLLEAILLMVMAFPLTALAGQEGTQIISPVFCIPFAGLFAVCSHYASCKGRMVGKPPASCSGILVCFILSFHFAIFFGAGEATEKVLECIIDDYLTFIVLLFGLFCVAGNITLEGDLAGFSKDQCRTSAFGNHAFQLGRNYRCQYVNGASCDQDERMEKEKKPTLWYSLFS